MPPPTAQAFDACGAAVKITTIDGYDSFVNVEELCGPSGVEEEVTENDRRRGTWWGLMAANPGALYAVGSWTGLDTTTA